MTAVTEEAARRFWDQIQEDGENLDFETCHERLKEFVAARISALEEALRECSEDLAVEIANYYKDTLDYPSQKRKYDRDMEPVLKARALLKGKEKE